MASEVESVSPGMIVNLPATHTAKKSQEIMLMFYRRLYPFKSIFQWLNQEHDPTRLFTHREFAFTLANDVYLRYNSFTTPDELKKQVCNLNPSRFEIGPVYSARVCIRFPFPHAYPFSQTVCYSQKTRKLCGTAP